MGLADLIAGIVDKTIDYVEEKKAEGYTSVSEAVDKVETSTGGLFSIVAKATKKAVDTAKSGGDMAKLLSNAQVEKAIRDVKRASEAALEALDKKVDETSDILGDILDFLAGGVRSLTDATYATLNWLTDAVSNPHVFLDWVKGLVLGAW